MPAQFYRFSPWVAGLVGADKVVDLLEVILDPFFVLLYSVLMAVIGLLHLLLCCLMTHSFTEF